MLRRVTFIMSDCKYFLHRGGIQERDFFFSECLRKDFYYSLYLIFDVADEITLLFPINMLFFYNEW